MLNISECSNSPVSPVVKLVTMETTLPTVLLALTDARYSVNGRSPETTPTSDRPCSSMSIVPPPVMMISYDWINPFGEVGGLHSSRNVVAFNIVEVGGASPSGAEKKFKI